MSEFILFTDASVNPKLKVGYGACLLLSQSDLTLAHLDLDKINTQVKIIMFENTSSTKLELQTLLWALKNYKITHHQLTVYTDSQNIIGLPARQGRFEKNNYLTSKNKLINNYDLYQLFYEMIALIDINFIKVKGHKNTGLKNDIDKLFTLVDRASRKALRSSNATTI